MYIHVYIYTFVNTDIHVHIHTYRYTCTHMYIQVYMYTYVHTGIDVHIRTYRYTCTRIHNTQSRNELANLKLSYVKAFVNPIDNRSVTCHDYSDIHVWFVWLIRKQ